MTCPTLFSLPIVIRLSAVMTLALMPGVTRGEAAERPNIVLMMCDDMGWGDTGFNGNAIIQTPELDALAREGTVLDHFYSVGPVCSPTRAAFLTGRHYFRMGVWSANQGHLPEQEFTLARMLKSNGYMTGHFGKWHLGTLSRTISAKGKRRRPDLHYAPPWERDYDASFVTESAVCTWDPGIGRRARNNPYYENGVPTDENVLGCDSRVLMDRAVPFIEQAVAREQPFLSVIWFHAPHEDIQAGPEYLARYEGHGEAAHYYGCITAVDDQIGRLRRKLDQLGVADNTLLFFCSDNGPEGQTPKDRSKTRRAGSAGDFSGRKRSVLDGGVRVPALVHWAGKVPAGVRLDVPLSVMDLLPTVAAITGTEPLPNRWLDGENVLPIWKGEQSKRQKAIPFRYGEFACLVRGTHKLIIESASDTSHDRLFDLSNDVTESNNLADQHPGLVGSMRKELLEFLESAKSSHAGEDYDGDHTKPVERWRSLSKAESSSLQSHTNFVR
ncbi:sulfatase family protein [Rhodopirellula islandica]|uniref:sulfatase family protein n=1 Tax=Rhodopirellula islandica TaxID=595434 RepID=UPI00064B51A4|nr:sulfatase-like hydrolase/transferase [Rhodopirellula islandica]